MNESILTTLSGGDTALAWLGAVALAAGGTAVVVALYILCRHRLASAWPASRMLIRRSVPQRERPATTTLKPKPEPIVPPQVGVAAYRAERDRVRPAPQTRLESPNPSEETAGTGDLDGLLTRLRTAAGRLEDLALRGGRAAGNSESYQALITGLDVEYLHRQN